MTNVRAGIFQKIKSNPDGKVKKKIEANIQLSLSKEHRISEPIRKVYRSLHPTEKLVNLFGHILLKFTFVKGVSKAPTSEILRVVCDHGENWVNFWPTK